MLVASELGAYGVSTLVVESRTEVYAGPRATTLHARALQCLVRRGYLPELAAGAGEAGGEANEASAPFHFAGLPGLSLTVPVGEPGPILKRPQAELEHMLERRARAAGARILRGHEVVAVRQDQHGVTVATEGPSGPVSCVAEYVVGADGARSVVREQAGIASTTYPATVSVLTGIVRLPDPDALRPGWHRTPRGWIVGTEQPEGSVHIRVMNFAEASHRRERPVTLDDLRKEASQVAGRDIPMEDPRWLDSFSDFSRLVRTYRAGRVLLAGDAAHVHFPIGGQGLSTGIQDALNLGWKLALTVQGIAGADLLNTYDQERRPVAQRVLDNTRAQVALMRPDPELDALRSLFTGLLPKDRAGGCIGDLISAQDTVLPRHAWSPSTWEGRFLQNVELRTPQGRTDVAELLRAGRPLLLLFGDEGGRYQDRVGPWADVIDAVHAEPTPEAPCDALLLRPDGYVAWASGSDGPEAALTLYFGRREPFRTGRPPASASRSRSVGGCRRSADQVQDFLVDRFAAVLGEVQRGEDGRHCHAGKEVV